MVSGCRTWPSLFEKPVFVFNFFEELRRVVKWFRD